jgi:hypothetical protein
MASLRGYSIDASVDDLRRVDPRLRFLRSRRRRHFVTAPCRGTCPGRRIRSGALPESGCHAPRRKPSDLRKRRARVRRIGRGRRAGEVEHPHPLVHLEEGDRVGSVGRSAHRARAPEWHAGSSSMRSVVSPSRRTVSVPLSATRDAWCESFDRRRWPTRRSSSADISADVEISASGAAGDAKLSFWTRASSVSCRGGPRGRRSPNHPIGFPQRPQARAQRLSNR